VLSYREVVEYPPLTEQVICLIKGQIEAAERAEAVKEIHQGETVPLLDQREQEHKDAEKEVGAAVYCS
jgi:hypothetical protein